MHCVVSIQSFDDCVLKVTADHPEFEGRIRVGDYKQIVKLECVQERDPVTPHAAAVSLHRYHTAPSPLALPVFSSHAANNDVHCRTAAIALLHFYYYHCHPAVVVLSHCACCFRILPLSLPS